MHNNPVLAACVGNSTVDGSIAGIFLFSTTDQPSGRESAESVRDLIGQSAATESTFKKTVLQQQEAINSSGLIAVKTASGLSGCSARHGVAARGL